MRRYSKELSALVFILSLTPFLTASPRLSLSTHTVGTVNLPSGANGGEFVQATNLGDGVLALTPTSSAPWLSATVGPRGSCTSSGGNCYLISIALNTAALSPGMYVGSILLTDPNAVDSPQDIIITVNNATVPGGPVAFYVAPSGSSLSSDILPIFTVGTGVTGTISTQSGGNWLQFMKGGLSPYLIQVSACAGQAPGVYLGQVVISGSSVPTDNKTIGIRLTVTAAPIIELTNIRPVRLTSYEAGPAQFADSMFSNAGQNTLTITGASGSTPFLSASITGPNGLQITADPAGLIPGIYTGSITISSNAANNSLVSVPVQLVVAPVGQPVINSLGIVNGANGAPGALSPGGIGSIYGNQLAPTGTRSITTTTPLPRTLGSTQVLVNSVPAPLLYVAPGQINFQVPYSLQPGQLATVQVVSNGKAGNVRSLDIHAVVPSLLSLSPFIPGTYGVVVNSLDRSLTLPGGTTVPGFTSHPARPGDTITIYAIGLGQMSPSATEGEAALPSTASTVAGVTAVFGGGFFGASTSAVPSFTGLTPTAVGLYEVNVRIPDGTMLGDAVPVHVNVNGILSNTVYLAISSSGQ